MTRVVITGIGLHSPLGSDPSAMFQAILAGETGCVPMPDWTLDELNTSLGAPCRDFNAKTAIPRKIRRTMGRVSILAASAAQAAVRDAGLSEDDIANDDTAVIVGSTAGSGDAEEEFWGHLHAAKSARGIKSTLFFRAMAHTAAANVALLLGATGEMYATNSACASGSQAIGLGAERIRLGRATRVICGGAEELHQSGAVIFDSLQAATPTADPDQTPRPFDAARDGIVVGEGAGILVLEERDAAIARGARIYGEVLGHGTCNDARHMAAADPQGMIKAIERCLRDAGRVADDVDYINAHATGTRHGDAAEAEALHALFGDQVPVSSTKGHLGHTLGACGAIESIVCLMALQEQMIPATRLLETPDVAGLKLPTAPYEQPLSAVLNTNFAFGGVNSVLLFGHHP